MYKLKNQMHGISQKDIKNKKNKDLISIFNDLCESLKYTAIILDSLIEDYNMSDRDILLIDSKISELADIRDKLGYEIEHI